MLEPLKWFVDESDFRFYLIDCGSGLMHLIIFPDSTVMLFDCNVTNEMKTQLFVFLIDTFQRNMMRIQKKKKNILIYS